MSSSETVSPRRKVYRKTLNRLRLTERRLGEPQHQGQVITLWMQWWDSETNPEGSARHAAAAAAWLTIPGLQQDLAAAIFNTTAVSLRKYVPELKKTKRTNRTKP